MGNKKKLFVAVLLALGATGCNKGTSVSKSEAVPNGTNPASQSESNAIHGYKSFKFGLPAVEVAKLPECLDEYKLGVWDNSVDVEKLKSDLAIHRGEMWKKINEKENFIKQYEAGQIDKTNIEAYEAAKQELASLNDPNYLKDETEKLAKAEADEKDRPRKRDSLAPDAIALWSTKAMCNVDFMGEKHMLKPKFENGKLVAVEIIIGEFSNAKYQSLVASLAEKYPLVQKVSPEQIAAFNNDTLLEAVTTYAGGQIGLFANNPHNAEFLNNWAAGTYTRPEEMVLVTSKHMKLVYTDQAHAQQINSTAATGKVDSTDL